MSRPSRETVLNALLATLSASVKTQFTAETRNGDSTLYAPSTIANLFVGLPVFGAGIPRGALITGLAPLTISEPATANAVGVSLTTGFQTIGRRLIPWSKCSAQPALFLRDLSEELEYQHSILQVQTITAQIVIYSNAGQDPDAVPLTVLNNLLDAIQSALAPDDPAQQRCTLGGLVFWCRLSGKIDKDPGDIGGQAVAVVDALITVP
jgi:hypothetical protein